MDFTKQFPAYVAWVNSQLRKSSDCRLVSDLRYDFQDGTVLITLLETLSGLKINGVEPNPKTVNSRRLNVEKGLHFMASYNMDTSCLSAKDINDGSLKSIMKLILEIAKYYKPSSVSNSRRQMQSTGYGSLDNRRQVCVVTSHHKTYGSSGQGLRVVQSNGRFRQFNYNQFTPAINIDNSTNGNNTLRKIANGDGDYAGTDSEVSGHELEHEPEPVHVNYRRGRHEVFNGRYQDMNNYWMQKPRNNAAILEKNKMVPAKSLPCLQKCLRSSSAEGFRDYENIDVYSSSGPGKSTWQSSGTEFLSVHSTGSAEAKKKQGTTTANFTGTPTEVKLVALQSYLHQTSEKCHDLHSNLQKVKQECASLEDTKSDFQSKIVQQDKRLLEMNQDVEKLKLAKQSLEAEKDELSRNLLIKDEQLIELRRQLCSKDKLIHQQKNQFDDAIRNLSISNKAKSCLTAKLADQDRKIALLEQARSQKTPMREELQVVHDALHSLRNGFRRNDPQHHTIDTLEQSFSLLMDRLHLADIQKMVNYNQQTDAKRLNFDSTGDPRRTPLTSYHGYCLEKLENSNIGTKVVYFTEKTVTPFMSSIPKRLGDIQLKDFKTMFDRPGNFRFHFKSVDPEYGMVKEEILQDDDVLPGWDGKIIAWVEEDHGLSSAI